MTSIVIAVICGLAALGLTYVGLTGNTEMRYNCELAEISPDFPAKVRKHCRELRTKS